MTIRFANCSPTCIANRRCVVSILPGSGASAWSRCCADSPSVSGGRVDDRLAATLEVGTSGNPFFIVELVRSLAETGALEINDDRLCLPGGVELADHLPVSITETFAQRLHRMDDEVRRLVGVGGSGRERVRPRPGVTGRTGLECCRVRRPARSVAAC